MAPLELGSALTPCSLNGLRQHPPVLRPYDERGARVDAVDFHPAYHAMERLAFPNRVKNSSPGHPAAPPSPSARRRYEAARGRSPSREIRPIRMPRR